MNFRLRNGFNVLALAFLVLAVGARAEFDDFISVDGTRLMDGDEPFRFIAFNVPTLFFVEDEMDFEQTNPYGLPTEFELRDLFQTVVETGGRVVRAYTIPVRNANFPAEAVTFVEGPGRFNEEAFRTMDLALALAEEYGIRVIIPFVNNWQWHGGRPDYAAFRGKTKDEFWTDPQLIADFKKTIAFILNRRNTVTGKLYRDDKTIMAWETGNELQNTAEWAIEIAHYVKAIDSKHLLIDGFHAIHLEDHDVWIQDYSLETSAFDLINTHHYEPNALDTVQNLKTTVKMVGGKKPVFLGEFGFISTSGVEEILDFVISEESIPGALIWSLRRHDKDGGFYHHSEPVGYGLYRAYHWPGFDDGASYDERQLLKLVRKKAFEIQGKMAPPISTPRAPEIIPFRSTPMFSWRGSMGAAGYDVERSEQAKGPWEMLAWNFDDVETPGFPLFSDTSATPGKSYFYRVTAKNEAGDSPPSAIYGPVHIDRLTRVDTARNFGVLQDSKGLEVRTGDYRSYKEAFSRLHGETGGYVTYSAPGELLDVRFFVYENPTAKNTDDQAIGLDLAYSVDGKSWMSLATKVERYASSENNYDYLVPARYQAQLPADARYVRASFLSAIDIVRTEIDYTLRQIDHDY